MNVTKRGSNSRFEEADDICGLRKTGSFRTWSNVSSLFLVWAWEVMDHAQRNIRANSIFLFNQFWRTTRQIKGILNFNR